MSENLPRWGLPAVEFVSADVETVKATLVASVERSLGRTLAQADPLRLALYGAAAELVQLRAAVNYTGQQNLLSYATGDNLDALGRFMGVTRLPASSASTTIRVTLAQALGDSYAIAPGYEVTNGVVTFATTEELVIPAGETSGEVSAACTEAGEVGNGYLAGEISTPAVAQTFIAGAENVTTTSGGSAAESDAAFADRIQQAPNSFSVAGPSKAYEYFARSVSPDIVDVEVHEPESEPGVVNVYLLTTGGELPSDELREQVAARLSADDTRDMCADVHVLAPTPVEYTLTVDYRILPSDQARAAEIRAAVEAAVEAYRLWQQSAIGRNIEPNKLTQLVMAAGAGFIETQSPSVRVTVPDQVAVAQCVGEPVVTWAYATDE